MFNWSGKGGSLLFLPTSDVLRGLRWQRVGGDRSLISVTVSLGTLHSSTHQTTGTALWTVMADFITGQTQALIGSPARPPALIGGEQINLVLYRVTLVIPVDVL